MINQIDKALKKILSDEPEYKLSFYDKYFCVIRKIDGKKIIVYYSHLDRIIEKDNYIAIFLKENLCFTFMFPSEKYEYKKELMALIKRQNNTIKLKHNKR